MIAMTDFESLFASLCNGVRNIQKRYPAESSLGVFYGVTENGYYRLSFLSHVEPPKLESTKLISVTQGKESKTVFWTCFDLTDSSAKDTFFAFCKNMISAVTGTDSEDTALRKLRKRYLAWKALFKKIPQKNCPIEQVQGVFGELYYLKTHMIPEYSADEAVKAWGGPDFFSKDFSIGNTWHEVKTVTLSVPCVKINSISQLSSDVPGKLAVVRVERMTPEYGGPDSSVSGLVSDIVESLSKEDAEDLFIEKIGAFPFDAFDKRLPRFDVKNVQCYRVEPGFPRITEKEVPYPEINNVTYEISLSGIARFLEG